MSPGAGSRRMSPQPAHCRTANRRDPRSNTLSDPEKSCETPPEEHAGHGADSRFIVGLDAGTGDGNSRIQGGMTASLALQMESSGCWLVSKPFQTCRGRICGRTARLNLQLNELEGKMRDEASNPRGTRHRGRAPYTGHSLQSVRRPRNRLGLPVFGWPSRPPAGVPPPPHRCAARCRA